MLVDEYQDTDHAQYVLIRELCANDPPSDPDVVAIEPPELMVVGDSDQSIYAFAARQSAISTTSSRTFQGEVILLEQNYRSTQTILSAEARRHHAQRAQEAEEPVVGCRRRRAARRLCR